MNIPTKPAPSASKLASQEKLLERETWHKLVVKVLSWKDGGNGAQKITPKEWKTYCQRLLETNITSGKEKTQANLNVAEKIIQKYNGFE